MSSVHDLSTPGSSGRGFGGRNGRVLLSPGLTVRSKMSPTERVSTVTIIVDFTELTFLPGVDICKMGPECGLCFSRRGVTPLNTWHWRRRLGPTTRVDRTGTYRRDPGTYSRVEKRSGTEHLS